VVGYLDAKIDPLSFSCFFGGLEVKNALGAKLCILLGYY